MTFLLKSVDPSFQRLATYLVHHKATIALAVFFMVLAGAGSSMISSKFVFEANVGLSHAAKSAITLVRDSCQVITFPVLLFWNNWLLAIVSIVIAPCMILLLRWISKIDRKAMVSSQVSIAEVLVRVKETYENHRIIKLMGAYDHEMKPFTIASEEFRNLVLRITKISAFGNPLTQLICMVGVAHRFSIEHANHVVVMQMGKVIEEGPTIIGAQWHLRRTLSTSNEFEGNRCVNINM